VEKTCQDLTDSHLHGFPTCNPWICYRSCRGARGRHLSSRVLLSPCLVNCHVSCPPCRAGQVSLLHSLGARVLARQIRGWRRRLTSRLYRALRNCRTEARSCSHPRRRPDMRAVSRRAARHPHFSTEWRTYKSCSG
jgi:hypothetical protein